MTSSIHVEVLGFQGCPNGQTTLDLVAEILASENVRAHVEWVEVSDQNAAKAHEFLGSPSVRMNGLDIEPSRRMETEFAQCCRMYRCDGESMGVPPASLILAAIQEVIS